MAFRGDRVAQLRKTLEIKQGELANILNTTQNQISRYERGVHSPSVEMLAEIAEALNTTSDYLLGLSNVPHPGAEPQPDLTPLEAEAVEILRGQNEKDQARLVEMLRLLSEFRQ